MTVTYELKGNVAVITINRPERMNAVDYDTAWQLNNAFLTFEYDPKAHVAVLTGAGGNFSTGADLKAIAEGENIEARVKCISPLPYLTSHFSPMGPTHMKLPKPVIAAVEGYALAGGFELALWADLRVAASDATFGFTCRERGVPLVDGGTVRLPRLIGHSRAADIILTGRDIPAAEAKDIGLVNYLVPPGTALQNAIALAEKIAVNPQTCLRKDWESAKRQWDLSEKDALAFETEKGLETIRSGEPLRGATAFVNRKPKP